MEKNDLKCQKCDRSNGKKYMFLNTLPKVLIVNFDCFNDHFENVLKSSNRMQFPAEIDIRKYLGSDKRKDKSLQTCFELFALVNLEGASL